MLEPQTARRVAVECSGAICDSDLMAVLVANGAQILCDMGTTPSLLTVTPGPSHVAAAPAPAVLLATVSDFVPMTNIKTFGMCNSPSNPAVMAATAAKDGVFTPAPCVPATADPWDAASAGDRLRRSRRSTRRPPASARGQARSRWWTRDRLSPSRFRSARNATTRWTGIGVGGHGRAMPPLPGAAPLRNRS